MHTGKNETLRVKQIFSSLLCSYLILLVLPLILVTLLLYFEKKIVIAGLFVCVCIELILGIRFALRYREPVKSFLEKYQSARIALHEKNRREKVNFYTLLFHGELKTENMINKEAHNAGVELKDGRYYVAVISSPHVEMLTNTALAFSMPGERRIAILMQEDDGEKAAAVTALIRESISPEEVQAVHVGIGKSYSNKTEIAISYEQAVYSLDKAIRENVTEALEYENVMVEFDIPQYPRNLEEKLIDAVKQGDFEQVESIFGQIKEENICKRQLSAQSSEILIGNICYTLLILCEDMIEDKSIEDYMAIVKRMPSWVEAIDALQSKFEEICRSLCENKSERQENNYVKLRSYMEAHYADMQFCMASAAEDFGFSECYFSLFFKEVMGKTFSCYIEEVRLEKAKEFIAEDKYDLETISELVGYSSSASFRRAFKRTFGVAPSVWKKENVECGIREAYRVCG